MADMAEEETRPDTWSEREKEGLYPVSLVRFAVAAPLKTVFGTAAGVITGAIGLACNNETAKGYCKSSFDVAADGIADFFRAPYNAAVMVKRALAQCMGF